MRFSLRMMMSGAFRASRRFRRLLRLITRRYRSFRSEVAKRPPSSCTMGRSSGGITGITSRIIHSGRLPESRKFSTISMRFSRRLSVLRPLSSILRRSSADRASRSMPSSSVRMASAPMPAVKAMP